MDKILNKAINGDKDAFIQIISSMERKLYIIAKSRISNEEDVKDVIQETIYQSYKNIKNLKDVSKFDTWIIRILINNCKQFYRKKKNITYSIYEDNLENELYSNNEYSKADNKIDFFTLLNLLDETERLIFTLFYSEDYTTKQISELLKLNENTIKSKIKRAREKIQKYIERWEKNGK